MLAERDSAAPFQVSTRLTSAVPRSASGLPGNPRIALVCDSPESTDARTCLLDALHRLYPYATVYPHAAARLDLRAYNLIISGGSATWATWMRNARINPLATHVRYCHAPAHHAETLLTRDREAARQIDYQIDYVVASSRTAQERIARDCGRVSTLIHPPVDLGGLYPSADQKDFYLIVSPLTRQAHVDVAARAFTRLGLPLMIAGDGPQRRALRRLAGPSVRLLGRATPAELGDLYARCRALIYLGCDDLPLAPLVAQAAGRPVLALATTGARETIVEGATGALFPTPDADILADAVRAFDPDVYRPSVIQRHARSFGEARFAAQFHAYLTACLGVPTAPLAPARMIHLAPLSSYSSPHRGGGWEVGSVSPPRTVIPLPDSSHTERGAVASASPAWQGGRRERSAYAITKRLIDIAGSGAGLLLLAPLFAIIALLIKTEDHGPVLHHREIVGEDGRRFYALKFRTMIPNADGYLLDHPNLLREYQTNIKLRRDPRITRTGAALRRTSLDELPQLVNVLRGQMSLVGPRMIHPSEEARYGDFATQRRTMRPGITGLWQVSGRQDVSYEQRIVLDQRYLRERSLWFDLAILLRTFIVVFRRQGAY